MNDKKSKLSLNDLERHLWEAAHIITGPIDASDYKTYIFPILFFKRVCDVYDEEFEEAMEFYGDEEMAKAPEQHHIGPLDSTGWQSTHAGQKEIQKVLRQTLFKCKLNKEQELFKKAYGYIREYY
jgi:type I restriction enzyme M protein